MAICSIRDFSRADFLHSHHRRLFLLRWKRPDAERPYKAFGYPIVPILYIVGATINSSSSFRLSNRNHVARSHHRVDRCADLFFLEICSDKITDNLTGSAHAD